MKRRARLVLFSATLALIGGCTSLTPTVAPSTVESQRPTSDAPTPVALATTSPVSSGPALEGVALELRCGGGPMDTTIIDYAGGAPGMPDIVAATRALRGIAPTDVVVRKGDSTVVIRRGQAIWRGDWTDTDRGYLLGQTTACAGVEIGT